jgi:GAF domain-containing protein
MKHAVLQNYRERTLFAHLAQEALSAGHYVNSPDFAYESVDRTLHFALYSDPKIEGAYLAFFMRPYEAIERRLLVYPRALAAQALSAHRMRAYAGELEEHAALAEDLARQRLGQLVALLDEQLLLIEVCETAIEDTDRMVALTQDS